jgi:hypothetical protein
LRCELNKAMAGQEIEVIRDAGLVRSFRIL